MKVRQFRVDGVPVLVFGLKAVVPASVATVPVRQFGTIACHVEVVHDPVPVLQAARPLPDMRRMMDALCRLKRGAVSFCPETQSFVLSDKELPEPGPCGFPPDYRVPPRPLHPFVCRTLVD